MYEHAPNLSWLILHRPAVSIEALAMLPEEEFLAGLNPAEQQRASDPHERVLMRLEQERLLRIDAVRTLHPGSLQDLTHVMSQLYRVILTVRPP